MQTGLVRLKDRDLICVFNWDDTPSKRTVKLTRAGTATDMWSGRNYGSRTSVEVELKPHEGTVLVVRN